MLKSWRIYSKTHQKLLVEVKRKTPRKIFSHYFFNSKILSPLTYQKRKLKLTFLGLISYGTLYQGTEKLGPELCIHIVIPNPLFFFLFNKIGFHPENPYLHFEVNEAGDLPFYTDTHIKNPIQVRFLMEKGLKKLEDRNPVPSLLYKDSRYQSFWQAIKTTHDTWELFKVTPTQWSYMNLEKKYLPEFKQQLFNELEEGLTPDPQNRTCEEEGCSEIRVRFSPYCKTHHIALVRGSLS